ncbi:C40 family peptidase [Domibacillus sp. DTU_2020_1001157_1_SI_ALB_TIR_016]|uniref:C40 family peptidase n=1 Tax=Domibacillus sp. DTU_2020_1001157_1_SI_ALB_TIR_016 TaxID=3077789 RepID=UPI0028E8371A|nr:C40 family peptidase [Domibacillus sp. DTU_2020_1001157_1_SI_ALB_TIR_016]WNS78485.1 C40 family peptidase [Domibacillus sp. DTU_2020_1001157_1_SI_ALB_TIR_016]
MKKVIVSSMTAITLLFGSMTTSFVSQPHAVEAASNYKQKAISEGKKVLGTPYKWGGTTTKGFDCSGFIGYAFKKAGKTLPRTTAEIYKKGKAVSKSNLQKGDLVYFQTYKKGPSHMGIYLGNNEFIHASSSKGVSITTLSNSYWKKRYIGAKRL